MKKILAVLAITTITFSIAFAQLKKDSTPDKRFKAYKTYKPKPIPKTKAGTLDMRYKINKKPNQ